MYWFACLVLELHLFWERGSRWDLPSHSQMSDGACTGCTGAGASGPRPTVASGVKRPAGCGCWLGSSAGGPTAPQRRRDPTPSTHALAVPLRRTRTSPCRCRPAGRPPSTRHLPHQHLHGPPTRRRRSPSCRPYVLPSRSCRRGRRKLIRIWRELIIFKCLFVPKRFN